MGEVIVTQFVTLDGVVSDPDGRWGESYGGWAFRYGMGPVADDKFRLGDRLTTGCQLYGRATWEHFSRLWPSREGEFAERMNAIPKHVATRSGIDAAAWSNSKAIVGDPLEWVVAERERRDVMLIGSTGLMHELMAADLVDEYRLVTFPLVVGAGRRLFREGIPLDLRFVASQSNDPDNITTLTILRRATAAA
jgi:dihydrofolate reductase